MEQDKDMGMLNIDTSLYKTRISNKFKARVPYKPANPKYVVSVIPGTIMNILVEPGQKVKKGDELMIVEAMKMQNHLRSPSDGKIKLVAVTKGEKVAKGMLLVEME
jgi:biotin carboxyl carrier protein